MHQEVSGSRGHSDSALTLMEALAYQHQSHVLFSNSSYLWNDAQRTKVSGHEHAAAWYQVEVQPSQKAAAEKLKDVRHLPTAKCTTHVHWARLWSFQTVISHWGQTVTNKTCKS
eukprot:4323067-Amphidinium_carterae.1